MIEVLSFLILISIASVIVNLWSLYKEEEEVGNCFSLVCFIIAIVLSAICIVSISNDYYEYTATEINGEITVDGKEYHFELKQDRK